MKIIFTILIIIFLLPSITSAELIDRDGGLIYDTDRNITWLQDANYAFTSGYDADGLMMWDDANTWANNLLYQGYNDWFLPITLQPDATCSNQSLGMSWNYNCTGSAMGHLYYTELGNNAGSPYANTGIFFNIQPTHYWSSTELAIDPSEVYPEPQLNAWVFHFDLGVQALGDKIGSNYAWAVRTGDSSPIVPEPISYILFIAGGTFLAGKRYLRRKKKA